MSRHLRASAFTMVEMLVSIAVLVMLVLLIAQLFNSATATATMSRKHIDAGEAASIVFDQMAGDFSRMVKRPDANYIFCKAGTPGSSGSSDAMFFYSEGPGILTTSSGGMITSGTGSALALVGYRINQNNQFHSGLPVLQRLGENLSWGGTPNASGTSDPGGPVFLPTPVSTLFSMNGWTPTLAGNWPITLGTPPHSPPPGQPGDTTHFQLLSDMVFRMEFCFLLKGGTYSLSGTTVSTGSSGYSNVPTAIPPAANPPTGSAFYVTSYYFKDGPAPDRAGNVYGFPPDLAGIVVTIAVLDTTSRKWSPRAASPHWRRLWAIRFPAIRPSAPTTRRPIPSSPLNSGRTRYSPPGSVKNLARQSRRRPLRRCAFTSVPFISIHNNRPMRIPVPGKRTRWGNPGDKPLFARAAVKHRSP